MKDLIYFIAQALVEHPAENEVEAGRGGGLSSGTVGPSENGAE